MHPIHLAGCHCCHTNSPFLRRRSAAECDVRVEACLPGDEFADSEGMSAIMSGQTTRQWGFEDRCTDDEGGVDVDCQESPALHLRKLTFYNVLLEEWYQEPLGSAKPSCSRC
jgi:hypothetical protein